MDKKFDSEDSLLDTNFDENNTGENAEFVEAEPDKRLNMRLNAINIQGGVFDISPKDEKIINKKTGCITIIKHFDNGEKEEIELNKDRTVKRHALYYTGDTLKAVTNYGAGGLTYTTVEYNADGSKYMFMEKYKDGTSDTIYYSVDKQGRNFFVKLGKNKEVLEKRIID